MRSFFPAIGLGLLVSFIFLNVNTLKSEKLEDGESSAINSIMADENETNGTMMNTAEAEAMIAAYKMYTTSPEGKMVTEGGVIDRKVLKRNIRYEQ